MPQEFDDLTDLVEHAQNSDSAESTSSSTNRRVENADGEKITLDDKI